MFDLHSELQDLLEQSEEVKEVIKENPEEE